MALSEIKETGFNNYNWKGLTLGALIAIREGLIKHDTILSKDLVEWLDTNYPEIKVGYGVSNGSK